jgi:hypothetical protein
VSLSSEAFTLSAMPMDERHPDNVVFEKTVIAPPLSGGVSVSAPRNCS